MENFKADQNKCKADNLQANEPVTKLHLLHVLKM